MLADKCPFEVGQTVYYRPDARMRGHNAMIKEWSELTDGTPLRIAAIVQEVYVVPEGFESISGGGLYWTAFSAE